VQAFDFIEADFAILIVFEFFLMTAEDTEFGVTSSKLFSATSAPQR